MKGDDIAERLLEFAVAVLRRLLPRRPPAQLSRSELIAHSQFPVLCSPVGLDSRLTLMGRAVPAGEERSPRELCIRAERTSAPQRVLGQIRA